MNFFDKKHAVSPTNQDFVWVANYYDGTFFTEFDYQTKKSNSFYSIDKKSLFRFGLVGQNLPLYFETLGGTFCLDNRMIDFYYQVDDKIYRITDQDTIYNDIIAFKDAFSDLNLYRAHSFKSNIYQYNFGYKKKLKFEEITISIKIICEIPSNDHVKLNVFLSSDHEMKGKLLILKNKKVYESIDAPLSKNLGGKFVWVVQ